MIVNLQCVPAPLCVRGNSVRKFYSVRKKILDLGETMQAGTPNTISIADGLRATKGRRTSGECSPTINESESQRGYSEIAEGQSIATRRDALSQRPQICCSARLNRIQPI